jgi:hypothetical protein
MMNPYKHITSFVVGAAIALFILSFISGWIARGWWGR